MAAVKENTAPFSGGPPSDVIDEETSSQIGLTSSVDGFVAFDDTSACSDIKPHEEDVNLPSSQKSVRYLDTETEEPFKSTDIGTMPLQRHQSLKRSSVKNPRVINTSVVS